MHHYTYLLLGHDGRFYYGVRSCKCDPHQDRYTGSYKDTTFSPKKKRILRLFPTRRDALLEEIRIHALKDVDKSKRYANKAKQRSEGFNFSASGKDNPNYGGGNISEEGRKRITESTRERLRDRSKNPFAKRGEQSQSYGRKWFSSPDLTHEVYLKRGENPPDGWIPGRMKRPPRSEESRERTRRALKGKLKSEQHKQKLSEATKRHYEKKLSQNETSMW